jgi:DNA-binding response OmpR family regulator
VIDRSKKRVLIVEDDQDTREVMVYTLEQEGFEVEAAPDGEQGLAAMRARRPDLVLLDLLMPRLTGREVLEAMRRNRLLSSLPVVIVSALPAQSQPAAVLMHLQKPFGMSDLIAAVRMGLSVAAPGDRADDGD